MSFGITIENAKFDISKVVKLKIKKKKKKSLLL